MGYPGSLCTQTLRCAWMRLGGLGWGAGCSCCAAAGMSKRQGVVVIRLPARQLLIVISCIPTSPPIVYCCNGFQTGDWSLQEAGVQGGCSQHEGSAASEERQQRGGNCCRRAAAAAALTAAAAAPQAHSCGGRPAVAAQRCQHFTRPPSLSRSGSALCPSCRGPSPQCAQAAPSHCC